MYPLCVTKVVCKPTHVVDNVYKREFLDIYIETKYIGVAVCILMNPSKATENEKDDTVEKVVELIHQLILEERIKINRLVILNLFSLYRTDSSSLYNLLLETKDKLGTKEFDRFIDSNRRCIRNYISSTDCVILGWGDSPEGFPVAEHEEHVKRVLNLISAQNIKKVYVFETTWPQLLTKSKQPRHPSRNKLTGLKLCELKDAKLNV